MTDKNIEGLMALVRRVGLARFDEGYGYGRRNAGDRDGARATAERLQAEVRAYAAALLEAPTVAPPQPAQEPTVPLWKLTEANNRHMNLRLDLQRLVAGEAPINSFKEVAAIGAMLDRSQPAAVPVLTDEPMHPQFIKGFKAGHEAGRARGREDAALAQPADSYRTCEFCGCHTNANIRACCEQGKQADLTSAGPSEGAKTALRAGTIGHVGTGGGVGLAAAIMAMGLLEPARNSAAEAQKQDGPESPNWKCPPVAQPSPDAQDAARYRLIRERTTCNLNQEFMLPHIQRVPRANLLRGSVSQHLDAAIDAALAKGKAA
jgi:hypothetical protein